MTAALAPRPHRTGAVPSPRRDQRPAPARPRLEVLDRAAARRRSRRRNALLVSFLLVLAGFFLVAFVHASLVGSQQELDQMRSRISELQAEKASVQRGIEESSAPARVVGRATELGMVPAEAPVFLVAVRPVTPAPAEGTQQAGAAPADGTQQAGAEQAGVRSAG